ncbi:hypothetical protein [Acidipropionibacterium acidipropionici]|nr:hypothetical protein [Acidipropionibacterium acidipropionici]
MKAGRKPKCAEPRVAMLTRLPETVASRIEALLEEADVERSDFVGYCTIQIANQLLAERGEELIEMPGYLHAQEPAIRRRPVPTSQEALMAG